jgi:hypothetical protein
MEACCAYGAPRKSRSGPNAPQSEPQTSPCRSSSADNSYGTITFLPNITHTGSILIIEGTTSEGLEAAGDFFTNARLFGQFEARLQAEKKGAAMPYFELLVKTSRVNGVSKEAIYVTHRLLATL